MPDNPQPTKAAMTPEKIEQGRKLLREAWPKNGKPLDPFARETFENEWAIPAADALAWLVNNAPALLVAAELGMASRWIPVSERLPEFWHTVLLHHQGGTSEDPTIESGYLTYEDGFSWHSRTSQHDKLKPTHWMPLPPPPTPEQP